MTTYRVVWEIDIEADTPADAARQAREIQLDPTNIASCFHVFKSRGGELDEAVSIDVLAKEGE